MYGTVELGDGEALIGNILESVVTPEDVVALRSTENEQRRLVATALSQLETRDAEVVRRLNLDDPPGEVDDLAKEMGMSRDRIRQIEKRALLLLRRKLIEAGFQLEALS